MSDPTDTSTAPDTEDDPTKPEWYDEMLAKLEEQTARADALAALVDERTKERDQWREHKLSDEEAQVISRCVKALDEFTSTNRSGSSYGYSSTAGYTVMTTATAPMRRVLRYLADRYGVTWYEPPAPTAVETP